MKKILGLLIFLTISMFVVFPAFASYIFNPFTQKLDRTLYGEEALFTTSTASTFCFTSSTCVSSWSSLTAITFLATTSNSYDGVITTSTLTGYVAANNICSSQYTGTHICSDGDIMSYVKNGNISSWGNDVSTGWYAEVAPGYLANANDCSGFKDNSNTYLGAFYIFNATNGGRGALVNCSNLKPIICCK